MAGASVSLCRFVGPQGFCGTLRRLGLLSQFLGLSNIDGPIFALGLSVTVQSIAEKIDFKAMQPCVMHVLSLCNLRPPTLKSNIKYNFYD